MYLKNMNKSNMYVFGSKLSMCLFFRNTQKGSFVRTINRTVDQDY